MNFSVNRLGSVVTEDRRIAADTPGVELFLRNKRRVDCDHFSSERTIVLMHGATFSSVSLFDVAVSGASFMDALAEAGFDAWAVDVRGYGGSSRPPEMDGPAEAGEPLTPAATALRDLASAVEFICHARGLARVNLLGMSWGGSIAGAFTSRNNERIEKLVLIAPLWLSKTKLRIDAGGPIGAYRLADVPGFEAVWRAAAPQDKQSSLIPSGWFERWAAATLATDPGSPKRGTLRAPNGAIDDIRRFWTNDRPFYDPAAITRPVLLVSAEWDVDVRHDMVQDLFARLKGAPYRRWLEIGEGTHMVLMEKNRRQVFDAVISFLSERFTPEI